MDTCLSDWLTCGSRCIRTQGAKPGWSEHITNGYSDTF